MVDAVTVINNNTVIVEVPGADAAAAIATAAVSEMAAQVASDLEEIQEIASGAPDAPSILNKLNKDGNNAESSLLANIGAVASADLADDTGAGLVGLSQSGTGGVLSNLANILNGLAILPVRFGAVANGATDDHEALQDALNYAHSLGGGVVALKPGATYRTSDTLVIGSKVCLLWNGATIELTASNRPVVSWTKDALNQGWSTFGPGTARYVTPQTSAQTASIGFQYAGPGVNSFNFLVQGPFLIEDACYGHGSPGGSGCFMFDATIDGVLISNAASWSTYIDLDTSTGGGTNMQMRNLFALQTAGMAKPDSKGHFIRGIVGLNVSNLMGDWLENEWVYLEACDGNIGHLAFENCSISRTGAGQSSLVLLSACPSIRIGELYGYNNGIDANSTHNIYIVRSDAYLDLNTIRMKRTEFSGTSAGNIYDISPPSGARIFNEYFERTDITDTPQVAALADFGTVKRIQRFNGIERTVNATYPVAADNAAAITAGLSVGMTYNTAAGEVRIVV